MLHESNIKYLDYLKNYWQLLAFGVFFLGFITFSFYIQINGFSFVLPDLKFLIAFGLIVFILTIPIILLSKDTGYNWIVSIIPTFFMPTLFMTDIYNTMLMLFTAATTIGILDDHSKQENNISIGKQRTIKVDTVLIIVLLASMPFIDLYYIILCFVNIYFFVNMQLTYKRHHRNNPFIVVAYILIISYLIALLASSKGLTIANMGKSIIEFSTDKNTTINGTLIFQDGDKYYIKNGEGHIVIDKSHISSPIRFSEYKYENNNSIFDKVKLFFK